MVIGDSNLDVTYYSYVTSRKYIVHVLFKVHFNLSWVKPFFTFDNEYLNLYFLSLAYDFWNINIT
jgi:hypothetical protein